MRRYLLPLVLLAATGGGMAARGDLVILQKMENAGQSGEMTMKVGADKIRTDVSPEVSTIIDVKSGDVTTLMHQQKSYMLIPAATTRGLIEQMKKTMQQIPGAPSATPQLQPTGKKEKINGYDAAAYTFSNGNMKGTYWIAADYPNAKEISEAMRKFQQNGLGAQGFAPDFTNIAGVPVKSEIESNGQKIVMELESVKEQPVDAGEYQVPAGYTEIKMPPMTPTQ